MKLVEIIVHCYAERIPDFALMLNAQLSSLSLWPPKRCRVQVTVCTSPTDRNTSEVVAAFRYLYLTRGLPVMISLWKPEPAELFRRAIGRNRCAKLSAADAVWFCDADYLFGAGCLDALAGVDFQKLPTPLAYPRRVMIHRSHAIGDREIERIIPCEQWCADLSLFEPKDERYAIGGLQIVSGDTARARGYLDGTRWVKPVDPAGGFKDTAEDKHYRTALGGSCPLDLPNVYRMRHSRSAFEDSAKRLAQTAGK